MTGLGSTVNRNTGASSSKINSVPFSSSHKSIPPPLASSTPKKSKLNGNINGFGSSGSKKLSNDQNISVNGNAINEGTSPKKRRIAYMDDSEEEDHGVNLSTLNGHVHGHANGRGEKKHSQGKGGRKMAELEEQRKQLPIAKGKSDITVFA